MKKFVLIALAGCSLGILLQAAVSEEPLETNYANPVDEGQTNDFNAKEKTMDSKDEGTENDLNDDNAPDVDGETDKDDEEDVTDDAKR